MALLDSLLNHLSVVDSYVKQKAEARKKTGLPYEKALQLSSEISALVDKYKAEADGE